MIKKLTFLCFIFVFSIFLKVESAEPKIETTVLDNGLKVTLIQVRENPVISSTLVMKVGLKHESKEINGVSHLLEHLTFNGTEKRTQKQLYDDFDKIGCYNNASTGDHYTGYYILVKKDKFHEALEIQQDMLFNSIIPENKIDKEKKIVLQEIRKDRMSPRFEKDKIIRNFLFPNSPYGMKVIGDEQSVTNIKREDILKFYKNFYSPKNCVGLVIGDFQFESMKKLLNKTIGQLNRECKLENHQKQVEITENDTVKEIDFSGRMSSYSLFLKGVKCNSKYFASQEVLASILNDNLSKDFGKYVDMINCSTSYTADFGYFQIEAMLKKGTNVDEFDKNLRKYLIDEFEINEKEVENVKETLKSEFLFALERPHFFGMLYAPYLAAGKDNLLFYNEVNFKNSTEYLKKLRKNPSFASIYMKKKEKK